MSSKLEPQDARRLEECVAGGGVAVFPTDTVYGLCCEPDARTLAEVPQTLRDGVDLVLDGGELPGTASTVVDLRDLASEGRWHLMREGALPRERLRDILAPVA